jgi:hypothetical protein
MYLKARVPLPGLSVIHQSNSLPWVWVNHCLAVLYCFKQSPVQVFLNNSHSVLKNWVASTCLGVWGNIYYCYKQTEALRRGHTKQSLGYSMTSASWEVTRDSPGQWLQGTLGKNGAASLKCWQDNWRQVGREPGMWSGAMLMLLFLTVAQLIVTQD